MAGKQKLTPPSNPDSLLRRVIGAVVSVGLVGLPPLALAQAPSAGTTPASIAASVYTPTAGGGSMIWLTFITLLLPNSSIRILSVQSLGPRERVVIASVVGRVYVLGHTQSQITLIAELSPEEVRGMSQSPAPMDFASRLSEMLRKVKK